MKTLFVTSPFGRRHGLSSWVQPLEPPPAPAASRNLNACPYPGHPDYFTLRYADTNGLVTGSPVTKAEIQTIAAQENVAYPGGCPPLPADATLSVPCNDGPDKHGYYDLVSGKFLLEQEGQIPNPHPLCPQAAAPAPAPAPAPPVTPPAPSPQPTSAAPVPAPAPVIQIAPIPTSAPAPQPSAPATGPEMVPVRIDVQAFTPGYMAQQGMGPIPVQNLPPVGAQRTTPAAPPPPPPSKAPEKPVEAPAKDLSTPLGIGVVVLGAAALALFG